MIDPTGRLHPWAAAEVAVSESGKAQPSKSQSFATALSDELGNNAASAGQASTLSTSSAPGQQNAVRRDPGVSGASTAASSASAPSLFGLAVNFPGASSVTASAAATTSTTAAAAESESQMSFDDAYWAAQPAAVQQLRDISNPAQRQEVGEQLAQQGYSIDVPIMVWGWDPQTTTDARESMGYSWVPSALQQPVEVAPGLSYNGTSYSSGSPPPGSITV